jgi:hypothetical protein
MLGKSRKLWRPAKSSRKYRKRCEHDADASWLEVNHEEKLRKKQHLYAQDVGLHAASHSRTAQGQKKKKKLRLKALTTFQFAKT